MYIFKEFLINTSNNSFMNKAVIEKCKAQRVSLKNYREKRTTNEFKYAITKSIFPRNNDEGDQAQRYYSKVALASSG